MGGLEWLTEQEVGGHVLMEGSGARADRAVCVGGPSEWHRETPVSTVDRDILRNAKEVI